MRHTVHQRIIGAILCGVVLIVSGSEEVCQGQVCGPDGEGCRPLLENLLDGQVIDFDKIRIPPAAKPAAPQPRIPSPDSVRRVNDIGQSYHGNEYNAINGALGQGVISKQDYVDLMNDGLIDPLKGRMQAYGNNLQNLVDGGEISQEKADLIARSLGKNSAAEVTAEDIEESEKNAEEDKKKEDKEKEEADTGHNSAQEDEDKTPTPKPGTCGPGGCNPGGGGCPGGGCNPGGGAGAAGFGGGGGILGGIAQMAQQMLPQLLQGLLQGGGQQGGGQQNGYGIQQLPPELYPDDADIMRQVEATQTAVYAEATAIAEQALQATATAEAIPPEEEEEEQDEETSESQPEAQPTATPITSPTRDSMIGGLE